MRYSHLLASTSKVKPDHFDMASQNLLMQAGYVTPLQQDHYALMHLGTVLRHRIQAAIQDAIYDLGGVEISLPLAQPSELRHGMLRHRVETGGAALPVWTDLNGRSLLWPADHETLMATMAKKHVDSYRQLPRLSFQLQPVFLDTLQPQTATFAGRREHMVQVFGFSESEEAMRDQYNAVVSALTKTLQNLGLPLEFADASWSGRLPAQVWYYPTAKGVDQILEIKELSKRCLAAAALAGKATRDQESSPMPLVKLHTPGASTIAGLSQVLGQPAAAIGKVVFFHGRRKGEERLVAAVVRGDMEVNPYKLEALTGIHLLAPATEAMIEWAGGIAGYASPVGMDPEQVWTVVDDQVVRTPNLVMGANETDYHWSNVCYGRDYEADYTGDIIWAKVGMPASPDNGEYKWSAVTGELLLYATQIGCAHSAAAEAIFMDRTGKPKPMWMNSFFVPLHRILGCLAEQFHDDSGLTWPGQLTPFQVYLVALMDDAVVAPAEHLYRLLHQNQISTLFDDRSAKVARAGEKFADADLLGMPVRITISRRSLSAGGVEVRWRGSADTEILEPDNAVAVIRDKLAID